MTDTTDQLATALIDAGAWLDHDALADDSHGEIPVLQLSLVDPLLQDGVAIFQQVADAEWARVTPDQKILGGEWVRITPEYRPAPPHLQTALTEVARRLDDIRP